MSLKHIAAAKLLTNNWSVPKLERVLEQADLKLSRALDYVMPNNIKVSCVQIALHAETSMKDCLEIILSRVRSAVADGSQLIVFPEYIGLLPLLSSPSLFDHAYQFSDDLMKSKGENVNEFLQFYNKYLAQPLLESYVHFFSTISMKSSIYILAGTTIVKTKNGFANRAFLFDPNGNIILMQDKLHLSPAEKLCGLIPGQSISAAQTKMCRVAVLSGQDQRVFEAAANAHIQGAQLLLCPSSFSFSRSSAYFQSCAFMRCQEQPVFAVSSWLTGDFMDLPLSAISGIYAPFSASKLGNGVIMQTEQPSANACITARIDLERLIHDPDLYVSDINPVIGELAKQEYALARQTSALDENEPAEEDPADTEPDETRTPSEEFSEEFHQDFGKQNH